MARELTVELGARLSSWLIGGLGRGFRAGPGAGVYAWLGCGLGCWLRRALRAGLGARLGGCLSCGLRRVFGAGHMAGVYLKFGSGVGSAIVAMAWGDVGGWVSRVVGAVLGSGVGRWVGCGKDFTTESGDGFFVWSGNRSEIGRSVELCVGWGVGRLASISVSCSIGLGDRTCLGCCSYFKFVNVIERGADMQRSRDLERALRHDVANEKVGGEIVIPG